MSLGVGFGVGRQDLMSVSAWSRPRGTLIFTGSLLKARECADSPARIEQVPPRRMSIQSGGRLPRARVSKAHTVAGGPVPTP